MLNTYHLIIIFTSISLSFIIYWTSKIITSKIYRKDYHNIAICLLKYANRRSSLSYMGRIDSYSEQIVLGNFHHLVGIKNPSCSEIELIRFCNVVLNKRNIGIIKISDKYTIFDNTK